MPISEKIINFRSGIIRSRPELFVDSYSGSSLPTRESSEIIHHSGIVDQHVKGHGGAYVFYIADVIRGNAQSKVLFTTGCFCVKYML